MVWRGTVLPQSAAFCGSPPRCAGALARPLSPESAALYWRSGALYCRKPPLSQYCLSSTACLRWPVVARGPSATSPPRCNGGQKATVLPQSAALLRRPARHSTAAVRLALLAGSARLFCRSPPHFITPAQHLAAL